MKNRQTSLPPFPNPRPPWPEGTTMNKPNPTAVRKLGIVGGLGSLAGGDLFSKLMRSRAVLNDQDRYHLSLIHI